jgi:hypothetical protein
MTEHAKRIVELMKEAFAGEDVDAMRRELSRGAHEIERLAGLLDVQTDPRPMRVWWLNDCEAYCGRTLLQAVRVAMADNGVPANEIIHRDSFGEIPKSEWATFNLWSGEEREKITLADVMSQVTEPQVVFHSL